MTIIRKAMVVLDSGLYKSDVIEHDGLFWLVPEWLDLPAQGVTMPRRIVSLATMAHQRHEGADPEFVVNNPIPKAVFEGRAPSLLADRYGVQELPEIRIPLPKRAN
jgi:hypothetical protein